MLAEVDSEVIVVGGDCVAGPFPREVLERLRSDGRVVFVRGNADRAVAEAVAEHGSDWCAAQLSDEERAFLRGLPVSVTLEVARLGRVLFCHAIPTDDEPIFTRISPNERVRELMANPDADVVVVGHTHVQFDRTIDGLRVVNAGSVGLPYEGERGAYWTLFGPDVHARRTEYDVEGTARAFRETGYPEADGFAEIIVTPPSRDEVTAHFERMANEGE